MRHAKIKKIVGNLKKLPKSKISSGYHCNAC